MPCRPRSPTADVSWSRQPEMVGRRSSTRGRTPPPGRGRRRRPAAARASSGCRAEPDVAAAAPRPALGDHLRAPRRAACGVGSTMPSRTRSRRRARRPVASSVSSSRSSSSGVSAASRSTRSGSSTTIGAGRPGRGACSSTTWALMPPKPKALTPRPRGTGRRSHGSARSIGRNRVASSAGLGSSQCRVGGSTPWCTASAALIRPAMPAAGMVWPIIDFTEPMTASCPCAAPNTSATVVSSAASPAGVAVPCASSSPMESGAGRVEARRVPGLADRADLAAGVGVEQARAAAVAGHAGAARSPRRPGRRRARRRPAA